MCVHPESKQTFSSSLVESEIGQYLSYLSSICNVFSSDVVSDLVVNLDFGVVALVILLLSLLLIRWVSQGG